MIMGMRFLLRILFLPIFLVIVNKKFKVTKGEEESKETLLRKIVNKICLSLYIYSQYDIFIYFSTSIRTSMCIQDVIVMCLDVSLTVGTQIFVIKQILKHQLLNGRVPSTLQWLRNSFFHMDIKTEHENIGFPVVVIQNFSLLVKSIILGLTNLSKGANIYCLCCSSILLSYIQYYIFTKKKGYFWETKSYLLSSASEIFLCLLLIFKQAFLRNSDSRVFSVGVILLMMTYTVSEIACVLLYWLRAFKTPKAQETPSKINQVHPTSDTKENQHNNFNLEVKKLKKTFGKVEPQNTESTDKLNPSIRQLKIRNIPLKMKQNPNTFVKLRKRTINENIFTHKIETFKKCSEKQPDIIQGHKVKRNQFNDEEFEYLDKGKNIEIFDSSKTLQKFHF